MLNTLTRDGGHFEEFCERVGDEKAIAVLETICEAFHASHRGPSPTFTRPFERDGVKITDVHQHNAINYTFSGEYTFEGERIGFVIHDGDWGGTEISQWGDPDDLDRYEPPVPTRFGFVPIESDLAETNPFGFLAYLRMRETAEFKAKEGGYNYDRFFAPGGKTESYYSDWATSRKLCIDVVPDNLPTVTEFLAKIADPEFMAQVKERNEQIAQMVKIMESETDA